MRRSRLWNIDWHAQITAKTGRIQAIRELTKSAYYEISTYSPIIEQSFIKSGLNKSKRGQLYNAAYFLMRTFNALNSIYGHVGRFKYRHELSKFEQLESDQHRRGSGKCLRRRKIRREAIQRRYLARCTGKPSKHWSKRKRKRYARRRIRAIARRLRLHVQLIYRIRCLRSHKLYKRLIRNIKRRVVRTSDLAIVSASMRKRRKCRNFGVCYVRNRQRLLRSRTANAIICRLYRVLSRRRTRRHRQRWRNHSRVYSITRSVRYNTAVRNVRMKNLRNLRRYYGHRYKYIRKYRNTIKNRSHSLSTRKVVSKHGILRYVDRIGTGYYSHVLRYEKSFQVFHRLRRVTRLVAVTLLLHDISSIIEVIISACGEFVLTIPSEFYNASDGKNGLDNIYGSWYELHRYPVSVYTSYRPITPFTNLYASASRWPKISNRIRAQYVSYRGREMLQRVVYRNYLSCAKLVGFLFVWYYKQASSYSTFDRSPIAAIAEYYTRHHVFRAETARSRYFMRIIKSNYVQACIRNRLNLWHFPIKLRNRFVKLLVLVFSTRNTMHWKITDHRRLVWYFLFRYRWRYFFKGRPQKKSRTYNHRNKPAYIDTISHMPKRWLPFYYPLRDLANKRAIVGAMDTVFGANLATFSQTELSFFLFFHYRMYIGDFLQFCLKYKQKYIGSALVLMESEISFFISNHFLAAISSGVHSLFLNDRSYESSIRMLPHTHTFVTIGDIIEFRQESLYVELLILASNLITLCNLSFVRSLFFQYFFKIIVEAVYRTRGTTRRKVTIRSKCRVFKNIVRTHALQSYITYPRWLLDSCVNHYAFRPVHYYRESYFGIRLKTEQRRNFAHYMLKMEKTVHLFLRTIFPVSMHLGTSVVMYKNWRYQTDLSSRIRRNRRVGITYVFEFARDSVDFGTARLLYLQRLFARRLYDSTKYPNCVYRTRVQRMWRHLLPGVRRQAYRETYMRPRLGSVNVRNSNDVKTKNDISVLKAFASLLDVKHEKSRNDTKLKDVVSNRPYTARNHGTTSGTQILTRADRIVKVKKRIDADRSADIFVTPVEPSDHYDPYKVLFAPVKEKRYTVRKHSTTQDTRISTRTDTRKTRHTQNTKMHRISHAGRPMRGAHHSGTSGNINTGAKAYNNAPRRHKVIPEKKESWRDRKKIPSHVNVRRPINVTVRNRTQTPIRTIASALRKRVIHIPVFWYKLYSSILNSNRLFKRFSLSSAAKYAALFRTYLLYYKYYTRSKRTVARQRHISIATNLSTHHSTSDAFSPLFCYDIRKEFWWWRVKRIDAGIKRVRWFKRLGSLSRRRRNLVKDARQKGVYFRWSWGRFSIAPRRWRGEYLGTTLEGRFFWHVRTPRRIRIWLETRKFMSPNYGIHVGRLRRLLNWRNSRLWLRKRRYKICRRAIHRRASRRRRHFVPFVRRNIHRLRAKLFFYKNVRYWESKSASRVWYQSKDLIGVRGTFMFSMYGSFFADYVSNQNLLELYRRNYTRLSKLASDVSNIFKWRSGFADRRYAIATAISGLNAGYKTIIRNIHDRSVMRHRFTKNFTKRLLAFFRHSGTIHMHRSSDIFSIVPKCLNHLAFSELNSSAPNDSLNMRGNERLRAGDRSIVSHYFARSLLQGVGMYAVYGSGLLIFSMSGMKLQLCTDYHGSEFINTILERKVDDYYTTNRYNR